MNLAEEFPVLRDQVFVNHAAVAPISGRAASALRQWSEEASTSPATSWPEWASVLGKIRRSAAQLINCDHHEIAIVHSTTHGLLLVANSLDWRPGDNVITCEDDFPANIYPWHNLARLGVTMRPVPERDGRFHLDDFIKRMDSRTRLVAVSAVNYATGFRMDLEKLGEICSSRGILLSVDGIQALGALPIDVQRINCDFLSANGHKWLLSPEGFGILYVRRSLLDRLNNSMTGWVGRARPADYANSDQPLAPSARRFEMGSHGMCMAAAFHASLELLLEVGQPAIWNSIERLTDQLCDGARTIGLEVFSPRGEGEKSGVVALTKPGVNFDDWVKHLRDRRIYAAARRGFLRIAPHFYNSSGQIEQVLFELKALSHSGSA